ncbi:MAG: EAL domain-containing protein [Rhodocyclaceae bacterium]|nr:EAL domain-containing protein [Rhodocyclaceae bacterium]
MADSNHSGDQFYQVAESSPDAIFLSEDGRFAYLNPAALRLFGASSRSQVLGQMVVERVRPERRAVVAERIRRLYQHGESASLVEESFLRLDGTIVEGEVSAVPFLCEGKTCGLVFVRDISKRKRAESELNRYQRLLRSILDNSAAVIFAKDLEGRYLLVNQRYSELFHVGDEAIRGRKDHDLFPAEVADALVAADRQVLAAGAALEFEEVVPQDDGPHTYIALKFPLFDADGQAYAVCGIATDITERKSAEQVIRLSESRLREAQRIARFGNWELDIERNRLVWSDEIYRLFEIDPGRFEASYEGFLRMVHPEDREAVDRAYRESVENRSPYQIVHRLLLPDGRVKHVSERGETHYGADGRPLRTLGTVHDITERKRAEEEIHALNQNLEQRVIERTRELRLKEEELREALALNENILMTSAVAIAAYGRDGQCVLANPSLAELVGATSEQLLAQNFRHIGSWRQSGLLDAADRALTSGRMQELETHILSTFGRDIWVHARLSCFSSSGEPHLLIMLYDITGERLAEEELRLAASVFHNSAEGVMVTDASAVIVSVNPAFTEITGYTEAEALGQTPRLLRSDHQGAEFYRAMWETLTREGRWQGEVWNRKKGGEAYLEWLTINRVADGEGVPVRYVGVFHDITEMRRKDEHIHHMAFHDSLTGLPNRALMQDRLHHALQRARREGNRLSLIFIDLDRFKSVNDGLGHDVGDLLLQEVACRIKCLLRSSDTVARLGGDEFVVLMENLVETGHCASLAQDILAEISRPMSLRGHTVEIGASLGMAFFPEDGSDPLELMKRADMAMYAAKSAGRNTYRFFQQDMLDRTSQRLSLEMDLRRAIAQGQLELHYQPRIELATGRPLGVEALVRWRHPTRGLIPPGDFIPLAEESGLILELGAWVLDEACRQSAAWRARGRGIKIAVNVSARQLAEGDLVERIGELAARHGIAPADLEIELTESAVMANPEHAAGLLSHLRSMGVVVAVDDFGTGYSSLAYLRRLPLDILKIDRSFVMAADQDEEDMQIVKMILGLGQTLKLTVVAEGIETRRQAELLQSLGCRIAQGYLYSRPLPAQALEDWLDQAPE